jgi:hypothetical protein
MRSSESRSSKSVVSKLLARVLQALAAALESRAERALPGDVPLDTKIALLRRRYPDAPEHWLRLVAEQTAGAEIARAGSAERAPAPVDPQRGTLMRGTQIKPVPRTEAHEGPASARREGAHIASGSAHAGRDSKGRESAPIASGTFPPSRTAEEPRAARFHPFKPRFRREPARATVQPVRGAAGMPPRRPEDSGGAVVPERRARRDGRDGLGRQRDNPRRPVTGLAEPALARTPVRRASEHGSASGEAAIRSRGSATIAPVWVDSSVRQRRDTVRPFPDARPRSAPVAPITPVARPACPAPTRGEPPSAAPAEPQWPELPPDSTGSGDGERRTLVVGVRPAEGSGPWNALPF